MKKLLSVLLCLALALSVTACGKKEPQPTPSSSPLPTPPPQEAPADEPKEDKSQIDPFEVEALTLTECLVASITELDTKKETVEFSYGNFFIRMATVEDDDFTYYGLAPLNGDGKREFNPERMEVIAYQVFGKEISAEEIFDPDDDFNGYDKSKNLYIFSTDFGLGGKYMAKNLDYASNGSEATVTFDLMEEQNVDGDPAFVNIGKATFKYRLSTEKGGAYWTFDGYTLS